ncbi:hypothetical protein EPJ64_00590 [Brachyspira aalborgi]|uniref:hypothetical protein n=1 Tax=Brachyspira aalborgi TaxID=29522 RepID=UPI0011CA5C96|nr:hypothetical protein [Brachyspira aalborgi]TXJ16579.1 hypothetical protein EPJ77_02325 [Brachyspira aalborgi]TXJ22685.1 hypothetical protein EPJ64_00590 [Brachyspira aalborgi]
MGKSSRATAETNIFTINTDGSLTIKGEGSNPDMPIPSSSVTRVSDTHYTASHSDGSDSVNFTFIFNSDTQGKYTMELGGQSATVDITKK